MKGPVAGRAMAQHQRGQPFVNVSKGGKQRVGAMVQTGCEVGRDSVAARHHPSR